VSVKKKKSRINMQDEEEFGRLYLVTDDLKKRKSKIWGKRGDTQILNRTIFCTGSGGRLESEE
jgi:hypothetical protein